jgi:hypothetical protein
MCDKTTVWTTRTAEEGDDETDGVCRYQGSGAIKHIATGQKQHFDIEEKQDEEQNP